VEYKSGDEFVDGITVDARFECPVAGQQFLLPLLEEVDEVIVLDLLQVILHWLLDETALIELQ
jgi:hypothetical protein